MYNLNVNFQFFLLFKNFHLYLKEQGCYINVSKSDILVRESGLIFEVSLLLATYL